MSEFNDSEDRVECFWIRIRGKANKAVIMVGVCFMSLNQDKEPSFIFAFPFCHGGLPLTKCLLEIQDSREDTN